MYLSDQRRISSLYFPSGLSVYSCCGCAWQMRIDSEDETKAEIAFGSHHCENFPITSGLLQPLRKLGTIPNKHRPRGERV